MGENIEIIDNQAIQNKIYTIRGTQVMVDRDLAVLYGVETRRLNEQVKRNIDRFPEEFMFQMSSKEFENWKSQIAISNKEIMGLRKLPYVFTEPGVSMLSAVLKSQTAIKTSIQIIKSFVNMRKFLQVNASLFMKIESIEKRQLTYEIKNDSKVDTILSVLEEKGTPQKQHIFYDGQIFDAYLFVSNIVKSAKFSIILIDNYVDESTLILFTKRDANVSLKIYTKNISKQLKLDLQRFNAQYARVEVEELKLSHDRFLIIDEKDVFHFGASLKDVGKKWFAVSKMDVDVLNFMDKLK